MVSKTFWRIMGRRFGLRNLAHFARSRERLLGLTDLRIGTIIDIGANKGGVCRKLHRKFPQAEIYAVEPIPEMCQRIEQFANRTNGKIHVRQMALANETKTTEFFVHQRWTIWSSLRIPNEKRTHEFTPINVEVDTLDNFAKTIDIKNELLIKIDTEGFDLEVIRGGRETLRRTSALIVEATFYPTGYGEKAPIFEDIVSELVQQGFVYRGNLRCAWADGVCRGVDAIFTSRDAAERICA